MTHEQETDAAQRKAQLRTASEAYFAALARKDFDAIPYSENIVLRAPIVPGGVHKPLVGREALRSVWWAPIAPALGEVKVIELFFNDRLTAVVAKAEIHTTNPVAVLRIADLFRVNDAGEIIEQENHFDPRDVTNPGWQNG
jgi:hypothetical protein